MRDPMISTPFLLDVVGKSGDEEAKIVTRLVGKYRNIIHRIVHPRVA